MMDAARLLLLPFLLAAFPAAAAFAPQELLRQVKLDYAQASVELSFVPADGSSVTRAKPDCSCTSVRLEGTGLVARVDTSTFDATVDKHIAVTTSDGQQATLTMRFVVPQAVVISPTNLVWERNAPAAPQELRLRIPPGSPVRSLLSADLSGDAFVYRASTLIPGREYAIVVSPQSTSRRALNRLVIKMDGPAPRFSQRIIYLRIK